MKTITIALGAAALAATGVAVAQQHGMMTGMSARDPLGSATITRAEAQAKAAQMFDRMDANRDGRLDQADRGARLAERFDRMDANHDGMLSRQEFTTAHEAMARGGTMRHGMDHGAMDHSGMEHRGMDQGGMDHGAKGARMMRGAAMRGHMMAMLDTNRDGTLTRDEAVAGALRHFDQADANHDGKLTPQERRTAMQGMMQRMRATMDRARPAAPSVQ